MSVNSIIRLAGALLAIGLVAVGLGVRLASAPTAPNPTERINAYYAVLQARDTMRLWEFLGPRMREEFESAEAYAKDWDQLYKQLEVVTGVSVKEDPKEGQPAAGVRTVTAKRTVNLKFAHVTKDLMVQHVTHWALESQGTDDPANWYLFADEFVPVQTTSTTGRQ